MFGSLQAGKCGEEGEAERERDGVEQRGDGEGLSGAVVAEPLVNQRLNSYRQQFQHDQYGEVGGSAEQAGGDYEQHVERRIC